MDIYLDGIEENNFAEQIKLFPNPAGEFISLDIHFLNGDTQIEILNSLGENVYSLNTSVNYIIDIPLEKLPGGIYHARIINSGFDILKSFVKE